MSNPDRQRISLMYSYQSIRWKLSPGFAPGLTDYETVVLLLTLREQKRVKGFAPSTSCLASKCSTAELHPQAGSGLSPLPHKSLKTLLPGHPEV